MIERFAVWFIVSMILWVATLIHPADFLLGMLHGFLIFPRWLLGLFFDGFPVYVCNAGPWYDFGFLAGLGVTITSTHE